jgi:hypothetical protein
MGGWSAAMNVTESLQQSIEHDWPCMGCGYNLRMLNREGRCPECGLEVAQSLRQSPLQAADPRWVRRMTWGLLALAVGLLGWPVATQVAISTGISRASPEGVRCLLTMVLFLPAICLLATYEPKHPPSRSERTAVRLLRIIPAVQLLLGGTLVALIWLFTRRWSVTADSANPLARLHDWMLPWVGDLMLTLYLIEPFLLALALWLLLRIPSRLAPRIPGHPFRIEATLVRWSFAGCLLAQAALAAPVQIVRMWLDEPPASGRWIDGFWAELIISQFGTVLHYALTPLLLWAIVFILRFWWHMWRLSRTGD